MTTAQREPDRALLRRLRRARRRGDGSVLRARCRVLGSGLHRSPRRAKRETCGACSPGGSNDLRIELLEHEADDDRGSAHWRAHYTFTQTGRPVVNDVHASFRFADGRIVEHRDEFDFHRWARQALGPSGLLLGWTPLLRSAVRRRARAGLEEFQSGGDGRRRRDGRGGGDGRAGRLGSDRAPGLISAERQSASPERGVWRRSTTRRS